MEAKLAFLRKLANSSEALIRPDVFELIYAAVIHK
jgi:hypothetical protein